MSTVGAVTVPGEYVALIRADLLYHPCDPFAVTMVLIGLDDEEVRWTFAWELLSNGLQGPTGEGDVRVRPVTRHFHGVEVALAPSFGVRVSLPNPEVASFVQALRAQEPGAADEVATDLDGELALIVAAADEG
ncbi:MAG: SsgA family sporulation/cell division regulator [Streptomyces sp.]|nr:SsgA family sporulation/cell division regulator [Streptomyces sp.]